MLLQLADRNGVRPLLTNTLRSLCWPSVPNSIQMVLDARHKSHVHESLLYSGELLRLLELFTAQQIPIAVFKGPVLAQSVYGDPCLRDFGDLDFLVNAADVNKSETLLVNAGYDPTCADEDFRSTFLGYQCEYTYRHRRTGIILDLHWRLPAKGGDEIWSRLTSQPIFGRLVPTFGRDDLILFLAVHGTKDGWSCLKHVCDFTEALRTYGDIDWTTIVAMAKQSRSIRPLLLAILLASRLLDAPVPKDLLRKAQKNSALTALAVAAEARFLVSTAPGELWWFLKDLSAQDSLGDRLRPMMTLVTTRTVGDYIALPLPSALWGLYYVTRPFRLAGKALSYLIQTAKAIARRA